MSQISILNNSINPPGSVIDTLTGNTGGAVGPSLTNNINIIGTSGVTVTGNPLTNTLTISGGGTDIIEEINTDNGGPVEPVANAISIIGATNQIETTGTGSILEIGFVTNPIVVGRVTALGFQTDTVAGNIFISGTSISTLGTDANVDMNFTPKGTGGLIFNGIPTGYTGSAEKKYQFGIQTTNATPTIAFTLAIAQGEMASVKATINGFRSTFVDSIGGDVFFTAYRSTGGNVTLVGAPVISTNTTSTTDITAVVNTGTQTMDILVTGVAAQTFNWVGTVTYFKTLTNA